MMRWELGGEWRKDTCNTGNGSRDSEEVKNETGSESNWLLGLSYNATGHFHGGLESCLDGLVLGWKQ